MDYNKLSRTALTTTLDLIKHMATLYAAGYNIRRRHKNTIIEVTEDITCNVTTQVNTSLIANALVYYVFRQGGEEKNMLNSSGSIYPAKALGKIYSSSLHGSYGKWACSTAENLNKLLLVYKSYPAEAMFKVVNEVFIKEYIDACRTTNTPVFSKSNPDIYVSRSVNKVITTIADIFAAKVFEKPDSELLSSNKYARQILKATDEDSEEDTPTTPVTTSEEKEEPVKEETTPQATKEEQILSAISSLVGDDTDQMKEKLIAALEEKKAPYVAELQRISREQAELEAKAAAIASKIESLDKMAAKLDAFLGN